MKAIPNRQLFTATVFDSGSLGVLASVIHPFTQPGRYRVLIHRGGKPVDSRLFEVTDTSPNMQLDIDLASVESTGLEAQARGGQTPARGLPTVSTKGFVLFFVSRGTGGYSVVVGMDEPEGKPVFDSSKLGKGDLFVLSLLKPTRYTLTNQLGRARGEIDVRFSPEELKRRQELAPQYIDISRESINPDQIRLISTQGLIFRVQDSARIVIERPPDDRGERKAVRTIRHSRLKPPARR